MQFVFSIIYVFILVLKIMFFSPDTCIVWHYVPPRSQALVPACWRGLGLSDSVVSENSNDLVLFLRICGKT